ncbi:efflux RND transporter periplasmic adaptor subunit [Parabacteroides sp. FAFU027]|uniref:efflux RND transporter periplasmic adaptor subunit n=1 Tax=Parabacteroides sp. FAFU027 TaxID=2922715 RepID=UPI001FB04174|nr:efflux RND transporter periplasmic adaptor subunit [Parabacteroides sp. FAFU027]
MKKQIKIAIGIVAIIGIAVLAFSLKGKKEEKMELSTQKATLGNIVNTVTATGTIEPIKTVDVGTQVSGTISKILVDYNSVVKKGQLLAMIDKTVLQSSLNSSKAAFEAAKNELTYQTNNYNRIKKLYATQSVSSTDLETAQYQYINAKTSYSKAKEDIIKAQTNLNYAMIYSPIDGVVISRSVNEGQTVAASFSTPTLFSIAQDLKKMQVVAKVDEADIGQVKEGQSVSFTVDAYPDDVFTGNVTQVRLEATTTSNVVTYQVVINAPNPDLKLKPGLTANVSINTLQHNNVLIVPSKALHFTPDAKTLSQFGAKGAKVSADKTIKIVWVKTDAGIKPVNVTMGENDGVNTEIINGLKNGDQVVLDTKAASVGNPEDNKASTDGQSPFMPKRPGSDSKKK